MTDTDKAFLGIGWSFPPEFDRQGDDLDVKMVSEEDDIKESLKILMSTKIGERVMQPTYGCGLHGLVFESIIESTETEMKDVIDRAILFFEPRISLNSIDIDAEKAYEGLIKIQLNYTVRTTNTRSNVVYPFYSLEGSQVRI